MSWQRWLCVTLAIGMAIVTPVVFGVSIWTIFLTAVFLACPVAVAWAYFASEKELRSVSCRPTANGPDAPGARR